MTLRVTMPLTEIPRETVTPMKPSEAIRLGSLLMPQAFDTLFETDSAGRDIAACAAGAATLAYGSENEMPPEWSEEAVPHPEETLKPFCYIYASGRSDLFGLVTHLNDDHRWTREAIADWAEGLGF